MDPRGLLRAVELVALPGTHLAFLQGGMDGVAAVRLDSYPHSPLYVDRRALSEVKPKLLPSSKPLIEELLKREGSAYIWGGNWSAGIPTLLDWYPPNGDLTLEVNKKWTLQGVDCSGLLYEVTGGMTPRNTEQLVSFGKGIACDDRSPLALSHLIKPLDLIVWKGHVIIALGDGRCIESIEPKGVVISPMRERLEELCSEWQTNRFVIRRWKLLN